MSAMFYAKTSIDLEFVLGRLVEGSPSLAFYDRLNSFQDQLLTAPARGAWPMHRYEGCMTAWICQGTPCMGYGESRPAKPLGR